MSAFRPQRARVHRRTHARARMSSSYTRSPASRTQTTTPRPVDHAPAPLQWLPHSSSSVVYVYLSRTAAHPVPDGATTEQLRACHVRSFVSPARSNNHRSRWPKSKVSLAVVRRNRYACEKSWGGGGWFDFADFSGLENFFSDPSVDGEMMGRHAIARGSGIPRTRSDSSGLTLERTRIGKNYSDSRYSATCGG